MSGSLLLEKVISSLVNTAPPGELIGVSKDLSSIVFDQAGSNTVNSSIEDYIKENGAIISSKYIAIKHNKDEQSTKYVDYINKKKFNIDLTANKAIDFEDYESDVQYPTYFDELVGQLESYGADHYPSTYAFTIIPEGNKVHVVIIGQRINQENYYTGQWKSHYVIEDKNISGGVKLDIHYYEDGNVRLNFDENVEGKLDGSGANSIINFINSTENKITIKIVENFNGLNQKSFKNLRRLLPVTRSKINWGSAIGNYKLGSDVVHKK
ncbi:F-actin-capping protein subunit alpha [Suhomyces tanzawaensis NRRL Y-17324]|uniref:F-actin-capping protein subunit alpha n=1 Tax=Suhomyces tanzawaensis NRRL Y-17324 TaxID=984487 RepID=A0A1E4SFG4_9ASCO|nr:F-actin-capping protein subunit alpha [Suhomyces tanzawaensis NRRL Y-17324]ODV78241.1 F-actin-capping protein subunit alpha [Suhomyces tanzawaensis NRRL Y-17324]